MWSLLLALWIPMQSTTSCPALASQDQVLANVIRVQVRDAGSSDIVLDKGTVDGVASTWGGWLVASTGVRVPGSEFCLGTVQRISSKAVVPMAAKLVKQGSLKAVLVGP